MSESPTPLYFEEHFEHCEGSLYDGDDFVIWLAQHDAEVARAERQRILGLLKGWTCGGQYEDEVELAIEIVEEDKK